MKDYIKYRGSRPPIYMLDGKPVTEAAFFKRYPPKAAGVTKVKTNRAWPILSDAAGVHPKQAKELSDFLKSKGVPTEVRSDGRPVLTDRAHRKAFLKARGFHDRNAGYGD